MKIEDMFSTFKNSSGQTIGQIDIFGPIGNGWGENGAKDFINKFRELEKSCTQIILNISSEGGSVFCGQQMASYILSSKVKTVAKIQALCASIATVIACACDKIIMPSNSLWMSHSPIMSSGGNAFDMRKNAELLDKIEETILNIYEQKCGDKCSRDELKKIIQGPEGDGQGCWMSAQECFDCGFVDEIGHELAIAAKIDNPSKAIINGIKMDLSGYQNLDKVREMFENKQVKNTEETEMSENKKVNSAIDDIANYFKNLIGVQNKAEIEETQEEVIVEESVEDSEQDAEQDEQPAQEEPATEGQEPEVETAEIVEPQQEEPEPQPEETVEPEIEPSEEAVEEEQVEEEIEAENEPSAKIENSIVPEVEASVDLASQFADLKAKFDALVDADAEKAIKLAKAELSKEVEDKFKGVPGKLEDKIEKIYSIKNSNLKEDEKEFVLAGLSLLSAQNLAECTETGIDGELASASLTDDERKMVEARALAEKENISEGDALLVKDGTKTLEQVKNKKKK